MELFANAAIARGREAISQFINWRKLMVRSTMLAAAILFSSGLVASAQAPQPTPTPQVGPAAQILTSLPGDALTVTHWYKQNVYDPSDNKIGEIMDVLV